MDSKTSNRSAREAALRELNAIAESVGAELVALRACAPARGAAQGRKKEC